MTSQGSTMSGTDNKEGAMTMSDYTCACESGRVFGNSAFCKACEPELFALAVAFAVENAKYRAAASLIDSKGE